MKRFLVLALAVLALVIAAPSAFATRVIFDPPASFDTITCAQGASCNITNIQNLNQPTSVAFIACTQLPTSINTYGSKWCLWLNNVSGKAGSTFTFTFNVPEGGSNSSGFECSSVVPPPTVVTSNCPANSPAPNSPLTVSFFAKPPLANNTDFYLFTDFVKSPGDSTVTVAAPEPGELGLFGLGLLAIGVGVAFRRRRAADLR